VTQLLLDTHVLIWLLRDTERISEFVYEQIRIASDENRVVISAITPWEIALLVSKKRLQVDEDVQLWIDKALALPGIRLYPSPPPSPSPAPVFPGKCTPTPPTASSSPPPST
jgi:PIN domain nuclease of toxin-antitoxin system